MSLDASMHTPDPAPSAVPAIHSVAQYDPQSARIAQEKAREAHNASVMRARARQKAKAKAKAAAKAKVQVVLAATPAPSQAPSPPPAAPAAQGDPQQIAMGMLPSYGWSSSQFSCLQPLWNAESGWNVYASNPGSGAYGIPQALPGSKMASAGADWQTSATVQVTWGLSYIQGVYGSPCAAWQHEEQFGWY